MCAVWVASLANSRDDITCLTVVSMSADNRIQNQFDLLPGYVFALYYQVVKSQFLRSTGLLASDCTPARSNLGEMRK